VELFVDGISHGPWRPGSPLRVAPGPHQVRLVSPSCFDKVVPLRASDVALDVELTWRHATLAVVTTPEGASVVLDPEHGFRQSVKGGRELPIPIPRDSPDGQEVVGVAVSADGYRRMETRVVVRAGTRVQKTIELEPNP
jgi:hypothetical protein